MKCKLRDVAAITLGLPGWQKMREPGPNVHPQDGLVNHTHSAFSKLFSRLERDTPRLTGVYSAPRLLPVAAICFELFWSSNSPMGERDMRRTSILVALLGLMSLADDTLALALRGPDMVYDDRTNLTWLRSATYGAGSTFDDGYSATDGLMTFVSAQAWVSQLSIVYANNGLTVSDWRLPDYDPTQGPSEIAQLVQISLGNPSASQVPVNWGPFAPLQGGFEWLGSSYNLPLPTRSFLSIEGWVVRDPVYEWPPSLAWATDGFVHSPGVVRLDLLTDAIYQQEGYAWAVRSGDVAAIPEPETAAMMLAGLGLLGFTIHRKKQKQAAI